MDNEKAMIISSDGHAMARMPDYRPYLPASYREDFDEFCKLFAVHGCRSCDPKSLLGRLDPDNVEQWVRDFHVTGRLDGVSDSRRRLEIMEEEGVAAEVLHPDFGLPFELLPPTVELSAKELNLPERTPEQLAVGNQAHNRWLVDFCSVAPERFAAMANVAFDDVDAAIKEITWAKEAGFKGVMIPRFDESAPLFDVRFDPIWSALEDLELPANSHTGMSSTSRSAPYSGIPHPALTVPLGKEVIEFRCHEILTHLIWGGVFERHPKLQVALTEQGSGWVMAKLEGWDFSYEGSYLRQDTHEVLRRRPSEYFADHCFFGSSIFSRREIEARYEIGLDKMCLGMDYPHHEGTFTAGGSVEYLRATLGAARVPVDEARMLLSENAIQHWGFDKDKLRDAAERFGPSMEEILTPPTENLFPRGDVNKPLAVQSAI